MNLCFVSGSVDVEVVKRIEYEGGREIDGWSKKVDGIGVKREGYLTMAQTNIHPVMCVTASRTLHTAREPSGMKQMLLILERLMEASSTVMAPMTTRSKGRTNCA
jgi:hypothetical protein